MDENIALIILSIVSALCFIMGGYCFGRAHAEYLNEVKQKSSGDELQSKDEK